MKSCSTSGNIACFVRKHTIVLRWLVQDQQIKNIWKHIILFFAISYRVSQVWKKKNQNLFTNYIKMLSKGILCFTHFLVWFYLIFLKKYVLQFMKVSFDHHSRKVTTNWIMFSSWSWSFFFGLWHVLNLNNASNPPILNLVTFEKLMFFEKC